MSVETQAKMHNVRVRVIHIPHVHFPTSCVRHEILTQHRHFLSKVSLPMEEEFGESKNSRVAWYGGKYEIQGDGYI